MNNFLKNLLSMFALTIFLFLAIGSTDELDQLASEMEALEDAVEELDNYDYDYEEPSYISCACEDVYGNCYKYANTCYTCGTRYCNDYNSLDYGKYCSQSCCAAYEGLSYKCGY